MTATALPLKQEPIPADLTPEVLARAMHASSPDEEAGGELLSEALNQLTILWDAVTCPQHGDEGLCLLARTVADAGVRLRRDAIAAGLVKEDEGTLHVEPGPTQYDLTNAVYALRQLVYSQGAEPRMSAPATDAESAKKTRYEVERAFEDVLEDFEFSTAIERTLFDQLDRADIESVDKYAIAKAGERITRAVRQLLARVQQLLLREAPAGDADRRAP